MAKRQHGGRRTGAGRKLKYAKETRPFSVTCPIDLVAKIDAQRGEQSRSEYTVEALRSYLKRSRTG